MKKFFSMVICFIMISCIHVSVIAQKSYSFVYDLNGKYTNEVSIKISDLIWKDDNEHTLMLEDDEKRPIDIDSVILENAKEYERIIIMDIKTDNSENPYPEIESMNVSVNCGEIIGGGRRYLGKDYRLIYFGDTAIDMSSNITHSDKMEVNFAAERLGKYVIYLNPAVYDVTFYVDKPIYDEDDNIINTDCIYYEIKDLLKNDTIEFPPIPQKDGYIFTGWKYRLQKGNYIYTSPQPLDAVYPYEFYASWCPEDEYEPIVIEITTDEKITKGKEDGKKITLKTNYGEFLDGEDFPSAICEDYYLETDEEIKEELLSEWKSTWNVVGSDEVMVESATRVDDKTVELTLSGNSKEKYKDSDIYIEFDSSLLMPEPYELDGEIVDWDDTKIKMDEDGVKAKGYRSDNAVTLSRQRRTNTSSSGSLTFSVAYETNGAGNIEKQMVRSGYAAKEPELPQKEGYVFGGWYTDKELTHKFDFATKIVKNITLYAKWDLPEKSNNEIIFTIGETKTSVFGEEKENDVAPIIKGNRAFLPVRFVAESLGASVEWDNETRTVTITKDGIKIVITIGEETAIVNGETITLDYPAFIENDRTYTPIRFIAESFGAKVAWNDAGRIITIIQ